MLNIIYKQIYETKEFGQKEWILILYNVSSNHYVAVPVFSKNVKDSIFIKSIDRYVLTENIKDYSRTKIIRCIYDHGKPLKITNSEYNSILKTTKNSIINYILENVKSSVDGVNYLKWCKDKYLLNQADIKTCNLKQNGVYWINMGYNIGSELRKFRPAILWRAMADKKTWTIIPLTTKKRGDKYYFHCDLFCLNEGSAKIENMMNYSYKRIISPYFSKNKLVILTSEDYDNISKAIEKYYLFK